MSEDNLLSILKSLIPYIENNDNNNIKSILQKISDHSFDDSLSILEFVSQDNWKFILLLDSIIQNENIDREIKILTIQILISFGELFPPIWTELAKTDILTNWVYSEIQSTDEEIVFYALIFFKYLLTNQLPDKQKSILGYNLVNFLIDLIIKRDEEGDEISANALDCLLRLSEQFNSSSFVNNKVLELLYDNKETSELGQRFISCLNRSKPEELYFISKLITRILDNAAMAHNFFYTNDLKVLLDVIIRELNDLPEVKVDEHRMLLLCILEKFIINTGYRKTLHRSKELKKTLDQFSNYVDKSITTKASELSLKINDYRTIHAFRKKRF